LLELLAAEERLLRDAREGVFGLYAALRKGNPVAVQAALPGNEETAARLRDVSERRHAMAGRLAASVGLDPEAVTLTALADRLPDPPRGEFLRLRATLRDLTAQVDHFRAANANLIDRLRWYFRDVLSGFAAQAAPSRYGPSGAMLTAPAAGGTVASG
jgi:hypothetical protein